MKKGKFGTILSLFFIFLYVLLGKIGLAFAYIHADITLVWPAGGLALAGLTLFGISLWPAVAIGGFLVYFTHHQPVTIACGLAFAQTLEAMVSTRLMQYWKLNPNLGKVHDVLIFLICAVLIGPFLSALAAVATLYLWGNVARISLFTFGSFWWIGNAMGTLLVSPFLLVWITKPLPSISRQVVKETAVLGIYSISLVTAAFLNWIHQEITFHLLSLSLLLLIWAALRLEQHGVAALALLISLAAVLNSILRFYGVNEEELHRSISRIWGTMSTDVASALLLAAVFSERKAVYAQQELLLQRLESKKAELEQFTYAVYHDLKTPLITIVGFLGLIKKNLFSGNGEKLNDYLNRIFGSAQTMQQLLDELLQFIRIGHLANPPEWFSFHDLVQESLNLVAGRLQQRGVKVNVQEGLPQIYGDRSRLLQVMLNLIDNSVKYMGEQSHPRLEIGFENLNQETCYYVRDNGMGIDPQNHEKIFGIFHQVDSSCEGTGIGLALVKRIIEVHGGKIWVESAGVGKGSAFFFTLPQFPSPS